MVFVKIERGQPDAVQHMLVGEPASLSPYRTRWLIESALVDEMSASSVAMVANGGQRGWEGSVSDETHPRLGLICSVLPGRGVGRLVWRRLSAA